MPWWGWIVIGTILFCAELFAVDANFYLIFVGAGAVVVGLTGLSGLDLPAWGQWLLFAILSIASMVAFRKKLYDKIRGGVARVSDSVVGETIALAEQLEAGDRCRTEYRGTTWTAENIGDVPIPSGRNAVIEEMDGLTLRVKLYNK
jgi:membrane protein implicated in regulation of membrane protease activity